MGPDKDADGQTRKSGEQRGKFHRCHNVQKIKNAIRLGETISELRDDIRQWRHGLRRLEQLAIIDRQDGQDGDQRYGNFDTHDSRLQNKNPLKADQQPRKPGSVVHPQRARFARKPFGRACGSEEYRLTVCDCQCESELH